MHEAAPCATQNDRGHWVRAVLLAVCLAPGALIAGGCAKAQASAAPDGPPLAVPAAPPRIIAPVDRPLAENPPAPEPTATPPPTTARPPAAPPRRPTTTATAPVEEPKPAETPIPQAPEPVVTRPVPTPTDTAAERKVRDLMRRSAGDLDRVDYRRLSANGKEQYEQAKRFNVQAEQELKDRNYLLATTLAEKAAAIATELLAR